MERTIEHIHAALPERLRQVLEDAVIQGTDALAARLARIRPLEARSVERRLERVEPVLARWRDATSETRQALVRVLPAFTGFDVRMIEVGLALACARLAPAALGRMVAIHPRLRGAERRRMAIITAGNVPALAPLDLLLSVLAGDPVALKMSADEPVTGAWFARDLREALEEAPAAALHWPGGREDLDGRFVEWADDVLAYGRDETLAAVASRVQRAGRGKRFLGRGHRVSVAWIPAGVWRDDDLARRLAVDVAMWDQEGCLSPHVAFIERGRDLVGLAERTVTELSRLEKRLPQGERSLERRAACRARVSEIEARMLAGESVGVWRASEGAATVIAERTGAPLRPSPLGRTIELRRVDDFAEMLHLLAPWRGRVQCLGVGGDPIGVATFLPAIERWGITRVAALGRMQEPGPAWLGEEGVFTERPVELDVAVGGVWSTLTTDERGA